METGDKSEKVAKDRDQDIKEFVQDELEDQKVEQGIHNELVMSVLLNE